MFQKTKPTSNSVYNRLVEHYVNLLSDAEKAKYLEIVWPMVESSYASIGGFPTSKEDIIADTSAWKLVRREGRIVAGQFFKDKFGRKMVCGFSDGSDIGRHSFKVMLKEILERNSGWMEASGAVEHICKKFMDYTPFSVTEKVLKRLGKHVEPDLDGFHYKREIGGVIHTKVCLVAHKDSTLP